MSSDYPQHHQQQQSSPPPAYVDATPGGMESEMYIDGTLYVNGVAVNRSDRKSRAVRQSQRGENPCETLLHWVRSKYLRSLAFRQHSLGSWIELWATQQTERIDRQQHKDKYVRTTLRELGIYLIFLTILSIGKSFPRMPPVLRQAFVSFLVVYGMVNSNMFILTRALNNIFVGPKLTDSSSGKAGPAFPDFDRMEDFWDVTASTTEKPSFSHSSCSSTWSK